MRKEILDRLCPITPEEREIIANGRTDINIYTKRKSKNISGATYFENGDEVSFRRHPRFADFPEHGHDYSELMIVVCGSVTHIVNGEKVLLSAGDTIILNRFSRHSICRTDTEDIGLNFLLSDKFLLSFIQKTDDVHLKKFFEENFRFGGSPAFVIFKSKSSPITENLNENLVCLSLADYKKKSKHISTTLALLLNQLSFFSEKIIYHRKTNEFSEKYLVDKNDEYREKISRYVDEKYVDGSLTECARLLGINDQYLSRLTKKLFMKNFKQLLVDKRIEEAEKLLLSSSLTVQEIAAAIGYENVYGFNYAFRIKHSVNPAVWRDKNSDR